MQQATADLQARLAEKDEQQNGALASAVAAAEAAKAEEVRLLSERLAAAEEAKAEAVKALASVTAERDDANIATMDLGKRVKDAEARAEKVKGLQETLDEVSALKARPQSPAACVCISPSPKRIAAAFASAPPCRAAAAARAGAHLRCRLPARPARSSCALLR